MNILKTKPRYSVNVGNGAFIADFYVDEKHPDVEHNYLHIHTHNHVFEQKIVGYPYGYLLAAVSQGNEEEVHNYCVVLWRVTQEIYQDAGLANDILRAFAKYDKRLMKQAEKNAAAVTDSEEMASQAFMEDIASEQGMSGKELKAKREADKELMREVLNEKEDENGESVYFTQ